MFRALLINVQRRPMLSVRYRICLLALLTMFLACGEGARPQDAVVERTEASKAAIEQRLIAELAPTEDRPGRQRNAIINRAIDQNYDVYAAPEGYFYEIIDSGSVSGFQTGDYVEAHYLGRFLDGTIFDSSKQRGQKLRFFIGELIPAWNLGIPRVKNGGTLRILAPSDLAYGENGLVAPDGDTLVPAHTVLEFLIEDIVAVAPPAGM